MISVCIATYNGEMFIKEQLDSILNQSMAVDEIIISDDSSTDNTIDIIKSYNEARIHLIENQKFDNPIFNIENALKQAKGDFIFLADQDDVWENNKVELFIKLLKTQILVISDGQIIDSNGKCIAHSIFAKFKSKRGFVKNLVKNSYMGCCMAFNRKLLEIVLPFPKQIAMHDLWIGLNAEVYGVPFFLPEKLIHYRRHGQNETPLDATTNSNSLCYKLYFRLVMLALVVLRYAKQALVRKNK